VHESIPETEPGQDELPAAPSTLVLELKPPPRVRPWLLVAILSVAAMSLASAAPTLVAQGAWDMLALLVFGVLMLPLGLLLFVAKASGRPIVQLGVDRMRLPVTTRGHDFVTLRYRDITELFVRAGRAGFVWMGTERGTFVYPMRAFTNEVAANALVQVIRGRLEPLPDWDKRAARFAKQQDTADRIYGDGLRGTQVLLGVMVVAYIVQSFLLNAGDAFAVVGLGANVPMLVKEGQLYRLVTSNLLHANPFHLVMNGMLVLWLGSLVERLLGRRTFILIVGVAALLGPIASALSAKVSVSVGISSVPFGMLGAYAYLTFRMKGNLPLGFTPPMRMWLTLGLLLAMMSVMGFGTDVPAHLGGFLAGVLVTAPLLDGEPDLPLRPRFTPLSQGLMALLAAVLLGGVLWGAQAALRDDGTDRTRATADFLQRQLAPHQELNRIAWEIVMDPQASPERLEQARIAAHRSASEAEPEERRWESEDTLATVYYRLGQFDEAIDREVKVLKAEDRSIYATQVARFLRARLQAEGMRRDSDDLQAPQFSVRYHASRGFGLDFEPGQSFETARTIWLLVNHGGKLQGLLRMELSAKTDVSRTLWLRQVGVEPVWHEGSTFEAAWIQAGAKGTKGWLMDDTVLTWP